MNHWTTNTLRVLSLILVLSHSAETALEARLRGQAVSDTDLDITWLADANLAATNTVGVAGINANGTMTWDTANAWIAGMNAANHLDFNDWRLAATLQPVDNSCDTVNAGGSFSFNCTDSEMGHLFYNELSGTANNPISGSGDPDLARFSNLQDFIYWSGLEFAPNPAFAWDFVFFNGIQTVANKPTNLFALPVRTGDVTAIAIPLGAWWLLAPLLALVGRARTQPG